MFTYSIPFSAYGLILKLRDKLINYSTEKQQDIHPIPKGKFPLFRHHNHNKEFYDLQNTLSPNWEKWKEKLEHALS